MARREFYEQFDQAVTALAEAALALWFRDADRESLRHALESENGALEWAKRLIREQGQKPVPASPPLTPEEKRGRRVVSAIRYQERNIVEGCPQPLDRNSVRYCTHHLEAERSRGRRKYQKKNNGPQPREGNRFCSRKQLPTEATSKAGR